MQQIYQQPEINDFSARPKVVGKKGKYRDDEENKEKEKRQQLNLMYDKRVIRGNTYASITLSKSSDPLLVEKAQHRLNDKNKPPQVHRKPVQLVTPITQQQHQALLENTEEMAVQTVEYVEMLSDRLPERDIEIQTDFYLDRPSNTRFRVKMEGQSVETQVEKGDLFDFDEEVEPILGMLCMKVIEQSRMEVLEEQELQVMKSQLQDYEQKVRAQRQEMQRLAEIERRKREEGERRQTQHQLVQFNKKETQKKLMDRIGAKALVSRLVDQQVNQLETAGLFNSQSMMLDEYHCWLLQQVQQRHCHNIHSNQQFLAQQYQLQATLEANHIRAMEARQATIHQHQLTKQQKELERQKHKEELEKQRQKQLKMQEREQFKNKLEAHLKKQEKKENVLGQRVMDIYSPDNKRAVVGMMGSVVGESIITMGTLHHLINQEHSGNAQDLMQALQTSWKDQPHLFTEMLELFLETVFFKEGTAVIPVDQDTQQHLSQVLGQEVNIDTLGQHITADNQSQVAQVLQQHLNSIFIDQILNNNLLQLDVEYLNKVLEVVMKVITKPELVANAKVEFQMQKREQQFQCEMGVKLSPLEDELNQSTNQDNSQSIFLFEDKVTLHPHHFNNTPLFIYQFIPTLFFRKHLLKTILNKVVKKFMQPKIEKFLLPLINRKTAKLFEDILQAHSIKHPQLDNPFIMEFEMQ